VELFSVAAGLPVKGLLLANLAQRAGRAQIIFPCCDSGTGISGQF
jgi:hypothetical protein